MDSHDEYESLIPKHYRTPLPPFVGFPIFALAFTAAIFGENIVGGLCTGLIFLVSLLLFPYYVVQLLMHRAMQKHLHQARTSSVEPRYRPNPRLWTAIYILAFFLTAYAFLGLSHLTAKT